LEVVFVGLEVNGLSNEGKRNNQERQAEKWPDAVYLCIALVVLQIIYPIYDLK